MTRAEQLACWQLGHDAGPAAAEALRYAAAGAEHAEACRELRRQRQADRQAETDALILDAIAILARAMLGEPADLEAVA